MKKADEARDMWAIEKDLYAKGFQVICGVDEAGRGPLAGSVYAAAVILPKGLVIEGLDDSKKLTPKKRDALYDEIIAKAEAWGVAFTTAEEIDTLNILNATYLAMNRAIALLKISPDVCIIDGNRNTGIEYESVTAVGGDGRSENVAAASVIAKVTRDRYMEEMAAKYPQYEFERHKGYGTALHYEKLRQYGPSPIHRVTFLKKQH